MARIVRRNASAVRRAASEYLSRGWSIVPLRPRDKRPLIPWEDLQQKRASTAEASAWFDRWPDANLGIVTGELSGLVVLDVDPKHGGDSSLQALERRHGRMPQTVRVISGGGGMHYYFGHPGGLIRNRAGLAQGIDLRGDGGYVVAPPSIHPSGRAYAWAPDGAPPVVDLAPLPEWLSQVLGRQRAGRRIAEWRALVRDGVDEGTRNTTLASLCGHLFWCGVDPEVALELLLAWNRVRCRPPLDDAEVAAVVTSITRLHLQHEDLVPGPAEAGASEGGQPR
jgi:Bifunctional DNA primase/polymerase, N-terminal/Primase C terminal 1 (PriCT-1)